MVFKGRCKFCGKKIEALSETQMNYNLRLHEEACKKKDKRARNYFTSADKLLHSSQSARNKTKKAEGRTKEMIKDA